MKKIMLFLILLVSAGCIRAQNYGKNIENVPPFRILRPDSSWFTSADLKPNKALMIIYFSPDCSHCQHLVHEMKPKMKEFKDMQIVMVTFTEFSMLKMIRNFVRDFDLAKYPNLTVGTEGHTYLVQRYYQVRTTPYIAIYDRKGKLVRAFDHSPALNELAAAAKKSE